MPRWTVHFNTRVQVTNPSVVQQVAEAKALASVIRGIPIPPYLQVRLDRLNILRAVQGTTGIEGTELTLEEVETVLEAREGTRALPGAREREEQEVRNARQLMRYIAEQLATQPSAPLTEELIRSFHRILTRGIRYENNTPGRYRAHSASAGTYLAPDGGEAVRRLMKGFVTWFADEAPKGWDPVVRAIVAHFYIVSIHPFGDGNGRTARGVESYLLYQADINARGFYSLANYYYRHRPEYIQHLDYVRFQSDPDLTPFVLFALRGLVDELHTVHREVLEEVRIISFRDYARETLLSHGKLGTPVGERQFALLLNLGRDPVSLNALRNRAHPLSRLYADVTQKTLARDLNFLKQHELVTVAGDELRANLAVMDQYTARESPRPRQSGPRPRSTRAQGSGQKRMGKG